MPCPTQWAGRRPQRETARRCPRLQGWPCGTDGEWGSGAGGRVPRPPCLSEYCSDGARYPFSARCSAILGSARPAPQPRTRFLRRHRGGPRQRGDPVERGGARLLAAGEVGERAEEADEDGDGGQGGQAACAGLQWGCAADGGPAAAAVGCVLRCQPCSLPAQPTPICVASPGCAPPPPSPQRPSAASSTVPTHPPAGRRPPSRTARLSRG